MGINAEDHFKQLFDIICKKGTDKASANDLLEFLEGLFIGIEEF